MKIKYFFGLLTIFVMMSCGSKYGKIPSEVTLRGLKGSPKKLTEISYANDSLLKLDEPDINSRTVIFDRRGNIIKTMIYKESALDNFTELQKTKKDTIIINSYLSDSTLVSVIKQWKTNDSTFEMHEYFVEEGVLLGEISSIKTILNKDNRPEIEEMTTGSGFTITTENIYSDHLLIHQTQTAKLGWAVSLTYRYLKFDEQQNWIERQCIINEGSGSEHVEYHVRTIEYFE